MLVKWGLPVVQPQTQKRNILDVSLKKRLFRSENSRPSLAMVCPLITQSTLFVEGANTDLLPTNLLSYSLLSKQTKLNNNEPAALVAKLRRIFVSSLLLLMTNGSGHMSHDFPLALLCPYIFE